MRFQAMVLAAVYLGAEVLHILLVPLLVFGLGPLPPQGRYNAAQRITYTLIILMGAASVLTGLAIYKPIQLAWLTTLLGGYQWARWEHFWLTMGYVGFFAIHIGQVIRAGWPNFRAMLCGYDLAAKKKEQHVA